MHYGQELWHPQVGNKEEYFRTKIFLLSHKAMVQVAL